MGRKTKNELNKSSSLYKDQIKSEKWQLDKTLTNSDALVANSVTKTKSNINFPPFVAEIAKKEKG